MAAQDEIAMKVSKDLEATNYDCTTLSELSGGSANFTYRGYLKTPLQDGAETIIVKHAEPYIARATSWAYDVTRSHYEATMLKALLTLPAYNNDNVRITTPHLYHYDRPNSTLITADYASTLDLKAYLSTHPVSKPQATQLGKALGQWTRNFHIWAAAPEQAPLVAAISENKTIAKFKCYLNYGRLEETIEKFPDILGECREMFQQIYAKKQKEKDSGDKTLIHGDFWSGNILIPDTPLPSLPTAPNTPPTDLTILDWEMSHLSSISYDLGQLFAELYLLTHFRGITAATWLIDAFMEGYGPLDEEMARNVALLFGTHLIVWPARVPGWGEGEVSEAVVKFGRDVVRRAWEGDVEDFKGGVLARVFFPGVV